MTYDPFGTILEDKLCEWGNGTFDLEIGCLEKSYSWSGMFIHILKVLKKKNGTGVLLFRPISRGPSFRGAFPGSLSFGMRGASQCEFEGSRVCLSGLYGLNDNQIVSVFENRFYLPFFVLIPETKILTIKIYKSKIILKWNHSQNYYLQVLVKDHTF